MIQEVQAWYKAARPRVLSILVAAGGATAVFGLEFTPAEQAGAIEGLDAVVVSLIAAYAAVNVLIGRVLEAFKADPDIDTGPTTPGPTTSVEV